MCYGNKEREELRPRYRKTVSEGQRPIGSGGGATCEMQNDVSGPCHKNCVVGLSKILAYFLLK